MEKEDIAVYGAGGFGREVACLINLMNEEAPMWNLVGFFDDGVAEGTDLGYGRVLGGMEALNRYDKPLCVAIAVGSPRTIKVIADKITNPLVSFPNLIAPNVTLLDPDTLTLGRGNIVCGYSSLSCNVRLGDFNVLNGYVSIGHDTQLGSCNVMMPSVSLSGGLRIGDCNFFGVKSTVLQYLNIGNNVRVGAGSVVMRNTKDDSLYMGNPAKIVKL